MSDLVERLRGAHASSLQRVSGSNIFEEAATELASLRERVKELEVQNLVLRALVKDGTAAAIRQLAAGKEKGK